MKGFLVKLTRTAVILAVTCSVAGAQDPNLHYVFRHKGLETLSVNWKGVIGSDSHGPLAELWVRKDGKIYFISDKTTLDAMDKATEPLRHYPTTGDFKRDHDLRATQRTSVYRQTDKIVQAAMAKGLGQPAKISKP